MFNNFYDAPTDGQAALWTGAYLSGDHSLAQAQ
jgi:hypothetical protein